MEIRTDADRRDAFARAITIRQLLRETNELRAQVKILRAQLTGIGVTPSA